MNAVEFVRKFGIERVKKILTGAPESANSFRFYNDNFTFGMYGRCNSFSDGQVSLDDLKQIVEAFELVMEHGSVERAKKYAESNYTAPEVKEYLLRAIELVEKCNENQN